VFFRYNINELHCINILCILSYHQQVITKEIKKFTVCWEHASRKRKLCNWKVQNNNITRHKRLQDAENAALLIHHIQQNEGQI